MTAARTDQAATKVLEVVEPVALADADRVRAAIEDLAHEYDPQYGPLFTGIADAYEAGVRRVISHFVKETSP